MKTFIGMILGAALTSMIVTAFALTGTPPGTGPSLIDGQWLNGVAAGTNRTVQSGIVTTGSTSATAVQLSAGIQLFELDTAPTSNGGVNLPLCVAGTDVAIYNATSAVQSVFPSLIVNSLTASQDTLDGVNSAGGAIVIPVTSAAEFYCVKNGKWGH